MIWDKESNVLPFFVGTYLGAKKGNEYWRGLFIRILKRQVIVPQVWHLLTLSQEQIRRY